MKYLLSALAAGVLAASTVPVSAADEVKVGAVLSIEGIFSAIGVPESEGVQLAVDHLNQAGGVGGKHINLTIYDDGGDQAKSVQLSNRLIFQDKVVAAFGPTVTPTGEMIVPVFEQNKVVEIGYVAQDYLWKDTQFIFMSIPTDAVLVEAMLGYAKKIGAKKIAIAYADVPYGVSGAKLMRQRAKNAGLDLVGDVKWGEGDIDFTPAAKSASIGQGRRNPDMGVVRRCGCAGAQGAPRYWRCHAAHWQYLHAAANHRTGGRQGRRRSGFLQPPRLFEA